MRVPPIAFGLMTLAAACGHSSDTLNLFFVDELVGAPARTVEVVVYTGTNCDDILTRRHDDAAMGGTGNVIARKSTKYPVNPSTHILDGLPRGMPVVLDVATYDRNSILMARACQVVTLPAGKTTKIDMEMRALPMCTQPPSTLDVAVVFDTSNAMAAADPSNLHLNEFDKHIIGATAHFASPASWNLFIDEDPDGPMEFLAQTTDVTMVDTSLTNLVTMHLGSPRIYDGVSMAARKLRARAVCGVRPMMLVFLSDQEMNPGPGAMDDAVVGIVATRGDMTDDIFTIGIALSDAAYSELNDLIPQEDGIATGAQGDFQIRMKMNDVGSMMRALIQ